MDADHASGHAVLLETGCAAVERLWGNAIIVGGQPGCLALAVQLPLPAVMEGHNVDRAAATAVRAAAAASRNVEAVV